MIIDEQLNLLAKEKQQLIISLSRDNKDEDKKRLLEVNQQLKARRDILIGQLKDNTKQLVSAVQEFKHIKYKKELHKQYKDMITQYREVYNLARILSIEKKSMRAILNKK